MYKKLQISAGGGIVAHSQQAKQSDAATILIGLGGTGINCLRVLKKEIFDRLQPDDLDSSVPVYKHIKFLAVDTDRKALADSGAIDALDEDTEFFDISCSDINTALNNDTILKGNPSLQWLKASSTQPRGSGIQILNAEAGAGGVRQVGRFLLIRESRKFVDRLSELIRGARTNLPSGASLNIHVFSGLGGGTGAGTFLDVCYLVQHALNQLGLGGSAQTCGFFFLPDVNLSKSNLNQQTRDNICCNGYASMVELDHCMNLEANGDEWNQQYDGFSIRTSAPPVKLTYLLSATNAEGKVMSNGYDYAMHVATDFVMEFLMKPYIPEGEDADKANVFTIESLISNVRTLISRTKKEHGAAYEYCLIGASNVHMPYKQVTTYLVSKIFEGFGNLKQQVPTASDVDNFLSSKALTLNDIHMQLVKGMPSIIIPDVDYKMLYDAVQGLTSNTIPDLLGKMRDVAEKKIPGLLEQNKKDMLQGLEQNTAGNANNASSLITRIQAELLVLATQADRGPYFAGAILHSNKAVDLENVLDGYWKTVDNSLQLAKMDLQVSIEQMDSALIKFQNSNKFNRKSLAKNYLDSVRAFYVNRAEAKKNETLKEVINGLKLQVENLYDNFYAPFHRVMKELEKTFSDNLETLSKMNQTSNYSQALMTIANLKNSLDASIKQMKIPSLIQNFINFMLHNKKIWISEAEKDIAPAVSSYFLKVLHDYTNLTMTDYLKIKYGTDNPESLSAKVKNDILVQQCQANAVPLFWLNGIFSIDPNSQLGFCSIPHGDGIIEQAANDYISEHSNITIRPSYNSDRISFLIFQCGIPMFAYKGIENYQKVKKTIGSYSYEGATGDPRDWRELRGIQPYSVIKKSDRTDADNYRASIVDEAIKKGLFYHKKKEVDSDYELVELDASVIEQQLSSIRNAIESKELKKIEEVKVNVTSNLYPGKKEEFINLGSPGYEEQVTKDLLIASDEKISKFKTDLDLLQKCDTALEQLSQKIQELEEKQKRAKSIQSDILLFADALCAGVVQAKNEFTFIYEQEDPDIPGFVEEVELTNIEAQPYGRHLPLYSAFLAFHELDQAKKDQIGVIIPQRIINLSREERDAFKAAAHEFIKPENIRKLNEIARMRFPGEAATITNHLKQIYKAIQISN